MFNHLPANSRPLVLLSHNHDGRTFYTFAGSVPAPLAYVTKDGQTPTADQLKAAHHVGPAIAGLTKRTWPTAEAARAAAAEAGARITQESI